MGKARRQHTTAKTLVTETMIQPLQRMSDDPAQLLLKAEACRRLADLTEDAEREALWRKRAIDWEQLATKAEKKLRAKGRARH